MKTIGKRQRSVLNGTEGKHFNSEYQPTSEAKKRGWQERRKQRLLTQSIIEEMTGENSEGKENLKEYVKALIRLAMDGNSKAIETVNRAIEDDIMKIQIDASIHQEQGFDLSKLSTETLIELKNARIKHNEN